MGKGTLDSHSIAEDLYYYLFTSWIWVSSHTGKKHYAEIVQET